MSANYEKPSDLYHLSEISLRQMLETRYEMKAGKYRPVKWVKQEVYQDRVAVPIKSPSMETQTKMIAQISIIEEAIAHKKLMDLVTK